MAVRSIITEAVLLYAISILLAIASFALYGLNNTSACDMPISLVFLVAGVLYVIIPLSYGFTLPENLARKDKLWLVRWNSPATGSMAHIAGGFLFLALMLLVLWHLLSHILVFNALVCDATLIRAGQGLLGAQWFIGIPVLILIITASRLSSATAGEKREKLRFAPKIK